jgi:large repetitive protein
MFNSFRSIRLGRAVHSTVKVRPRQYGERFRERGRGAVLGPIVVAVVLVSGVVLDVPVFGGHGPVAGAQTLFQMDCPGLAGLTVQWQPSSTWSVPALSSAGTWSGPMTIDDNGGLSGQITANGIGTVTGNVMPTSGCSTPSITFLVTFPGGDTVTSTGGAFSVNNGDNALQLVNASFDLSLSGQTYNGSASGTAVAVPTVTVTPPSPNPGLPLTPLPVTYTVTVAGTGPENPAPTPGGTVNVSDGQGGTCSSAPVVSGSATCMMTESASGSPYTITATYSGDPNYGPSMGITTMNTAVSNGSSTVVGSGGVTVTGTGGTSGTDTETEVAYGSDPVPLGTDGTNYFDVAVSQPSGFTSLVVQDCNSAVTSTTVLQYWTGSSWQPAEDPAGAATFPYGQVHTSGCVSVTIDTGSSPTLAQLQYTVFTAVPSRSITSVDSADAMAGSPFSLIVTTAGSPTPSIKKSGKLPKGLRLVNNHNGTATLSGTPSLRSGGLYKPIIKVKFGSGSTAVTLTQAVTLFVFQAPTVKNRRLRAAHVGVAYSATVNTKGYPEPTISQSGGLPDGMTITDNGNGTATLAGTPEPGSAGTYGITIMVSNREGNPATKNLSLVVKT